MRNTKSIIAALVLLFSASSAFAATVCQSTPGYMGNLEVHSYKAQASGNTGGGVCDPALGCDGYIGIPLYTCSNLTGTVAWAYVLTGSAYDNALVNMVYFMKQAGKPVTFSYKLNATAWNGKIVIGGVAK